MSELLKNSRKAMLIQRKSLMFPTGSILHKGCKSGVRSLYATRVLVSSGFKSVRNMDGGYIAWMEKRFPVKVELKYDEL
ncbi:hypothetical protein Bca52824_040350 [Brassica carinata]|uniref:Rhodanese domain-containing protein n=1 Tax=Brassica carinata TaxID=52824 RepID=A0A8X7RSX3_BRACI|nr:hypothetical protein Bca52824_040350 [Brassica carinata]